MSWVTKNSEEAYPPDREPQREYTKKEIRANWWEYHRWMVLLGIVAAVLLFFLIKDTVFQTRPDYQIAWVGQSDLPADTVTALSTALEQYGTDRNGDGKIVVSVNSYTVNFDATSESADAYYQMAGVTKLSADLSSGDGSYIFLMQDPAGFEGQTQALQYLDGTLPGDEATDWQNMCYLWSDCPVLAGLDLGSYTGYTLMDDATGDNQQLLSKVYVGRRGVWKEKDQEKYADDVTMWDALTAGAQPMAAQ